MATSVYKNFDKSIKDTIDEIKTEYDAAMVADQNLEVVNARGTFTLLRDRLNNSDSRLNGVDGSLIQKAKKVDAVINVFDVPQVTFEGSTLQNLIGDGTNQYANYDRLARYLKSIGGGTLYFPAGTFSFSKMPLYRAVSISGAGAKQTIFKALQSAETSFIYLNDICFDVSYKDFTVQGISTASINVGQNGIYVKAIDTSYNAGGIWNSCFKRIVIQGFGGTQLYFEAVDINGHDLLNQFLYFEQVEAYRLNDTTSRCLVVKGEAGQFNFNSCNFDNPTLNGVGTNIELNAAMCNFTMLTSKNADYAINITGGVTNFTYPWFENVKYSVTQAAGTDGNCHVSVKGGNFSNAGYDAAGNGYVFYIGQTCTCDIDAIFVKGNVENVYKMHNLAGFVNIGRIFTPASTLPSISFHTKQTDGTPTFDMGYARSIALNTGGIIKTLTSKLPVESTVTLVALQGNLTIQTGGNINIDKTTTLFTNGTITLKKIDLNSNITWSVESIYNPQQWSTVAPSSGSWNVGEKSYNSAPVSAGVEGWVCTVGGTFGTLNAGATKGSITSGTNTLTVTTVTGLVVGYYITIVGVSGIKKITAISGTTVTLDSNASATVSVATVAFSAPTFKGFGVIQ